MTDESQSAAPEEEFEEEAIIPEEDFREAIAACRRDRELDRYFKMAPPGAKLFIGLGFYSTHFGDRVDPRQYAECQAEIEPALTVNDLKYLIRFERDKATKKYLRGLLARHEAENVEEVPVLPEPVDAPIVPPKRKRRRMVPVPDLRSEVRPEAEAGAVPPVLKIAVVLVLLLGGALALYFSCRVPARTSAPTSQVVATGASEEAPSDASPRAEDRENGQEAQAEAMQAEGETAVPAMAGAGEEEPPPEVAEAPAEEIRAPIADDGAKAPPGPGARGRKPRVVFTDGKKIVRRPNGRIEVPRVFSCAGAGIKPFWVYGAHPEAEAAKEMKAREEWQALVSQAEEEAP
jgi:hypothetical protein